MEEMNGKQAQAVTLHDQGVYHIFTIFTPFQGDVEMRTNLKNARKDAGLTQDQMAQKLYVGLRHYKRIEHGDTLGSIDLWDAMEDLLGVHQRILREIHPDKEDSR